MIIIDQVRTHGDSNTGDDTVPPGIVDLDWCHVVSTVSQAELEAFLTDNFMTIGCPVENVRTPALGSLMTYAGLSDDQRTAAVLAGASPQRPPYVAAHAFDSPGSGSHYEP